MHPSCSASTDHCPDSSALPLPSTAFSPAISPSPSPLGASYPSKTAQNPAQLAPRVVVLRPALGNDHFLIDDTRMNDRAWLAPWEPTSPPNATTTPPTIRQHSRMMDRQSRAGDALVMMLEVDGNVAGIVTAVGVTRGALYGCTLGYWVASWAAGLGLGAWSVATTIDLLIGELNMHRVEINIRPENAPSLALARKLGLREEGYKPRYLHINGNWADHIQFAVDSESLPEYGLVHSLLHGFSEI